MNKKDNKLNFDTITSALEEGQAVTGASEAHGLLCGIICAGTQMDGKSWVEPLLGSVNPSDINLKKNRTLLLELYDKSGAQLHNFSFDFQVLLPDDNVSLENRSQALSEWCGGFLGGLGLAGINLENGYLEECREAIDDFVEISKLDYSNVMTSEADEEAYMQVVEYVRMAVLLVYTVMATKQNRSKTGGRESLH